ncbi:MAG: GAF domain-containing protein, partial [Chloroflexi bacterium]|nr:GAF domain-containing protein [Chloroflexota bacterium]
GLIGLLVVSAPAANDTYAPEVLLALDQLAHQAARPVAGARQSARAQQCLAELTALHDACLELGAAQEADQILYLAATSALHLTNCDVAWAWLLDENTNHLVCRSVISREDVRPIITAEAEFTELVFQHHTLLVQDASTDPRVKSLVSGPGTGALAAVPLPVGQKQRGILVIQNSAPHSLHQHAVTLLETQAQYATLAIAKAQLETELRRFNQELELRIAERTQELTQANIALHREKDQIEALYEIVRELSTSPQVDQVLGKALRLAASAVGAERGSVMVLGSQSSQLSIKVILTAEGQLISTNQPTLFQAGVGLVGWVVKHQRAALVADVNEDPRWQDVPEMKGTIRSAVAVPLIIDAQECLGVLFLAHASPHYFGADHLRVLSIVANEMAVAIHNAELDQYVSNQADELAHALREKETTQERMRVIVENVADGVLVNDMEGQILMVNQAAEEVLGIHARTMEGQRWQNIGKTLAPAGYAEVAAFITEATARASYGGFQTIERVFDIAERVIQARLSPVITRSGEALGVVAVFDDMTYERELDRIKTDFVSTVSHELRTPLTSIKGYVDLVLDGDAGEISPDVRDFLQVVKTNSDRLTSLVADLLDISRLEAGRIALDWTPLRVHEIVEQVMENLTDQIQAGELTVTVDVPKHLPAVRGDHERVAQVIANLLSNAIKYTLPGGQVHVQAQASSTHVQISIQDSGIGIAPDDQARLFTKFFRADHPLVRQAGGTGLGLPISKTLVELHGGEIWVSSEVDQGSTFTFTLPLMGRDHGL